MKTEDIQKFAQDCFQKFPTIVLGSGASMSHGLPSMDALSSYLRKQLKTDGQAEKDAWLPIKKALNDGDHLEAALEDKTLPDTLLSKIVVLSWQCVNEKDMLLLDSAASNSDEFALGRLLAGMFKSTQTEAHVVTTNYDRVAEYACNSKHILYQTGFAPGYVQKWENLKFSYGNKPSRVVKIWKVHGSLDWFRTDDERTVGLPVFELPPTNYTPLIVTPGPKKYKKTHEDPFRTTITGADNALNKASAFLCVGYGFRDQHIHPKINERCRDGNVPIVVLAKTLTEEAKDFLSKKAGTSYMGIEKADKFSRVYSPNAPNGTVVTESDLWSLHKFNNLFLR